MIIFWVGAAKHYIRPAHETIGKLPKVRISLGRPQCLLSPASVSPCISESVKGFFSCFTFQGLSSTLS